MYLALQLIIDKKTTAIRPLLRGLSEGWPFELVLLFIYNTTPSGNSKISAEKEPDVRWPLVKVPIRTSSNPQNREPDNLGESALRGRGSLLSR